MQVVDELMPCEWDGCRNKASVQVFNSKMTDSAFLCSFHKRVAAINLEQYDRIRISPKMISPDKERRPGMPGRDIAAHILKKSTQPGVEDWEQRAAQIADANAFVIDPQLQENQELKKSPERVVVKPLISDIPSRRRE